MKQTKTQETESEDIGRMFTQFMSMQAEAFQKMFSDKPVVSKEQQTPPKATGEIQGQNNVDACGKIKFTEKEIQQMPQKYRHIFAYNNEIVTYRIHKGTFEARYRRNGFNIEVCSVSFEVMKQKFIQKLHDHANGIPTKQPRKRRRTAQTITFAEYAEEWLKIKEQTTKPSTFKEYRRSFEVNLKPTFGDMRIGEIDRMMIQDFLFGFVNEGKGRTAEKLKLQLNCIFDMAVEDFNIPSPMKKIVLPRFESKKGSAFTKEEERQLVEFCISKQNNATSSALLVLLYFGLRQSELASLRIVGEKYLECETSKELLGKNVVVRRIPFTPVFKKVLPYVDFEKARDTNPRAISSQMYRLFPNHHPHELRYTYITRCKECGVNPEVVMLWDGHEQEKGVVSSRVDRGYTDYSEEYLLSEAEKVNYEI